MLGIGFKPQVMVGEESQTCSHSPSTHLPILQPIFGIGRIPQVISPNACNLYGVNIENRDINIVKANRFIKPPPSLSETQPSILVKKIYIKETLTQFPTLSMKQYLI